MRRPVSVVHGWTTVGGVRTTILGPGSCASTLRSMPPIVNSVIALVALGLAIAAIVLATIANRRWAARSTSTDEADSDSAEPVPGSGPPGTGSSAPDSAALESLGAALAVLRVEVDDLLVQVDDLGSDSASARSDVAQLRSEVSDVAAAGADPAVDPTALRRVALVRYDAFADVGGRLSYSVALLDDTGSGLVLTTLSGKADVRTYVRTISGGSSDGSLTAEEQQAIDAAVGSGQ